VSSQEHATVHVHRDDIGARMGMWNVFPLFSLSIHESGTIPHCGKGIKYSHWYI
jgi:hypothetical protein